MTTEDFSKSIKDKPTFAHGISMKDVERFKNIDVRKYAVEKKPRIVKSNPFLR